MKVSTHLILLFAAFVCMVCISSSATAFEPEKVGVNPELEDFTAGFFPPKILNVTDGVYVARGYNRDNPVLIEGTDGLIVIDPGESIPAAEIVKEAYNKKLNNIFETKPVKAIIYTHHHDCHIHGASVFANNDTEIIAHENLNLTLYSDWFGQVYPSRADGGVKMSGSLFANDPDWFAGGGLFATQIRGPSGYLPPTKTVKDKLETNIAGVSITLLSVPGETRDVLVVWLPEKDTMVQIANYYQAFPAITTIRGAFPRNPLDYIDSIDVCRSLEPEYLVLPHGPQPVVVGEENISRMFTNGRDAIQFVHDQTVQNMNKGLTPGEIMDVVKLPPHLASDPNLQEYYGQVDRDIYEIFWWYRGFYSGKARDMFPQSPAEEAEMAAELAGGVDELTDKARNALDEGNLEWALVLADDVLLLNPENAEARKIKNSAMISIAENTPNAQTRNYILSEYLLETKQVTLPTSGNPKLTFATMEERFVPLLPMDTLHRIMAVSLDASECLDKEITVGLQLTDMKNAKSSDYALYVRKGIVEIQPEVPEDADFTITTSSMVWKNMVLGKLDPQKAVSDGKVNISGADSKAFYEFMALFE
ncbi:alkyl sulfatase dimerization domain-containing protein [Methanosarcina hadiensis]|uniref:alkyl sulfatase dimerization domain-containing protein n=1 Tax=Methanosarcina hadiensis TaxID=3078083 RepID=UPI0039775CB3